MMRRDFIIGNSAVLTACTNDDIASPRLEVKPVKPKPKVQKPSEPAADPHAEHAGHAVADDGLVDVTSACVRSGRRCLAHCLAALGGGDTSMAECARTASDMIAVNEALLALAAAGSKLVKAQVAVARDACSACQESCQAHAGHPECKACADSCGEALAAFARVLG